MEPFDLPADWPALPITRPDLLPGVLDHVVTELDRSTGALWMLICDTDDRLSTAVQMPDLHEPSPRDRERHLTTFMGVVAELDAEAGVLAAIARPGGLSATVDDRDWADALARSAAGRVRLLGVHVVTVDGSRPVPASSTRAG